jgi:hypothetical protein
MPKKDASKAEFVRALPVAMPAKEVVEKAKEAGHKLSVAYVYVIRSQARTGRKKSTASKPSNAHALARLLAAASEIGLTRSIELLTAEKARIVRLLR